MTHVTSQIVCPVETIIPLRKKAGKIGDGVGLRGTIYIILSDFATGVGRWGMKPCALARPGVARCDLACMA